MCATAAARRRSNRRDAFFVPFAVSYLRLRARTLLLLTIGPVILVGLANWPWGFRSWDRENPLANAVAVRSVHDGVLTLVDGRRLQPAGIRWIDSIDSVTIDNFLRIATAQGIVVTRDLGDGRAFMRCEPRFCNWCGTSRTWAGAYYQFPLSVLSVRCGYATPDLDQPLLDPIEQWRLEGVQHLGIDPEPTRLAEHSTAIRYSGDERLFSDYDDTLALLWKPAPTSAPN